MSLIDAAIDTKQRIIFYRDFQIEESIDGWEYWHERVSVPAFGACQTPFEAIEAVDAWYERETA